MANNQRMAASVGAINPFVMPGPVGATRTYTCAAGSTIDVEEDDARMLATNGWVRMLAPDGWVGPTTSRPPNAHINKQFIDTTLNIVVVSDGHGNWLNALTGVLS